MNWQAILLENSLNHELESVDVQHALFPTLSLEKNMQRQRFCSSEFLVQILDDLGTFGTCFFLASATEYAKIRPQLQHNGWIESDLC